jgi:hypothetical protein
MPVKEAWPNTIVGNYWEVPNFGPVLGDYASPVLYVGDPAKARQRLRAVRAADPDAMIIPWVKLPVRTEQNASFSVGTIEEVVRACKEADCAAVWIWWDHTKPQIHNDPGNFDDLADIMLRLNE